MSCTKHFLSFEWTRHQWERQVTGTSRLSFQETDQWGRRFPSDYVMCQAQYVCRDCGAIREEGDCGCDPARAEHCKVRLDLLDKTAEQHHIA